jgi:hypothetical protein
MRINACVPVCSSIFRLFQNSIVNARVTKNAGTHWNTLEHTPGEAAPRREIDPAACAEFEATSCTTSAVICDNN